MTTAPVVVDDDQSSSAVPAWVIAAGIGLASFVVYKALFSTAKFPVSSRYVHEDGEEFSANYPKGERYWVTNPFERVPIRFSRSGGAALRPTRVFEMFERAVQLAPDSVWLLKEYKDEHAVYQWRKWTRQEVYDITKDVARGFISLGLQPWQSVAIIGFNAPEWHFADLGAIYAGGLVAGVYTTNNAGQCKYVCQHSKAAIIVCENEKQLLKILAIRDQLDDTLKSIIIWDPDLDSDCQLIQDANANHTHTEEDAADTPEQSEDDGKTEDTQTAAKAAVSVSVMHWREFIKLGRNATTKQRLTLEMEDRIARIDPGHCCTLIYTSGTTGPPKAVMLSHDNITWGATMFWNSATHFNAGPHATVSYLPMSHAAAQLADLHYPMAKMAKDCTDFQIHFARPDALKGSLSLTIKTARPTFFFGVPRVWEKFFEAIKKKTMANPPSAAKLMLINYLKSVGLEAHHNCEIGSSRDIPRGYTLAKKILFPKLTNALGFDRCQGYYTGAAPVQRQTLEFFASLGIPVLEVYGMSESCGVHTLGLPFHNQMGTVGPAMKGVETLLQHDPHRDKAGNGEICMRGRHVMMGYMYDAEKTARTIDDEGWLHSGDVGSIDKYNLLRITGRIKELIITAGGENIAPVPIEEYVKRACPALSNVVLVGDQKKYLVCLVTLRVQLRQDERTTMTFGNELSGLALKVDPRCQTVAEARASPVWQAYIERGIKQYNADKEACVSKAQCIQYFKILDGDFGIESGELTSTMKLKRPVVAQRYSDVIESMYNVVRKK